MARTRLKSADLGETRLAAAIDSPTGVSAGDVTHLGPVSALSAAARKPLEAGEAFGSRYHIMRELGVGGMGAVYQAWDAELGIVVAIKTIRADVMADPAAAAEIERRFKRELLLARQVTHKNVVRIHDLGEIDGVKYITMTYVDGSDLASLLAREGRLAVPAVMRIARDVVSGLVEAHKAGVVHRDLKPPNIMIEKSGNALIMDFGIARSSDARDPVKPEMLMPAAFAHTAAVADATRLGAVIGTVEYMAPEQARAQQVDQRADIYSLGLMLYDMLVGREHRAQHTAGVVAELQDRMVQAPASAKTVRPDVPDALDRLVSRCVQPDPAMRYQTSEELAADLNRLDDDGVPIPEPRRFTLPIAAAAASVVVVLVAGTWWLTRTPPPEKAHDPVSVLIADFENHTGDQAFDNALEQDAKRALEGASFISAYDRPLVRSTFRVQPPATFDANAARDLALKQGLGVVLAGSIRPASGGYEITATASETVSGRVIVTTSAHASSREQVLPAANKLMTKVRKALGDPASESAQLFAMRSLTTSSPEVVRYYAAALEAQAQTKWEEARQNYLKAVGLDPKFGLGYQGLATTSSNLGRPQDAQKYIEEALRNIDSMTDRERFATRGYYDKLIGDNAQCVKEYGDLLARYPADALAHSQRAICFVNLRDMQSAAKELGEAVRTLPNHVGLKTNLALLNVLAGQFDAAEQQLKTVPTSTDTLRVRAYGQAGRGQLPEAAATYRQIAAMGAAGASLGASGLADIAIYEGRFSDAIRILEEGTSRDLAANSSNGAAIKLTSIAYAELLRGDRRAAVAAADRALASSKSMVVRFLAARVLAEAGALDKARAQAASLSSELPAQPRAYGRIIDGLIALNSGNPRDAIRVLNETNTTLDTWFGRFDLGRAYLAAGALPQADSEFDRCIARRGETLSLMDQGPTYGYFPAVYYYQGRVRESLKTASFADQYRHYLEARGGSAEDPLLPEVRRRAAR